MDYIYQHKKKENRDKLKSAIITLLISSLLILVLYFYKFTRISPIQQEFTTMLINFGDQETGDGTEEPKLQEGSLASTTTKDIAEPISRTKPVMSEKIITGHNANAAAHKNDNILKKNITKSETPQKNTKNSTATSTKATTTKVQGDGRGTAAVGNLIRGRGNTTGSQGVNGTRGNTGDPLGGSSDGDSRIGVDRNLTHYIPGTYGRGGTQPGHTCTATGTITIAYVVDKAGNVVSARRSGGISDACVVSTSVSWVKQYVKAERANTSSTGSYRITF